MFPLKTRLLEICSEINLEKLGGWGEKGDLGSGRSTIRIARNFKSNPKKKTK